MTMPCRHMQQGLELGGAPGLALDPEDMRQQRVPMERGGVMTVEQERKALLDLLAGDFR